MSLPLIDFHCDLLSYLAIDSSRKATDSRSRCSTEQLRQGNVGLQVLAVFTETVPGSSIFGEKQVAAYFNLEKNAECHYLVAIENASAFSEENEAFEVCLRRFKDLRDRLTIPPVYVSLTWNKENRFGGGAHTDVGLKSDGERLIDAIAETSACAVDLSHASDRLAEEILNYIDTNQLRVPVIASHSNCRSVQNSPRNLPDELILEIVSRKGLIGLNFYGPFLGEGGSRDLLRHVEHYWNLGAENSLCFGADFFFEEVVADYQLPEGFQAPFFPELGNASCYPSAIEAIKMSSLCSEKRLRALAYGNALKYLEANSLHASADRAMIAERFQPSTEPVS